MKEGCCVPPCPCPWKKGRKSKLSSFNHLKESALLKLQTSWRPSRHCRRPSATSLPAAITIKSSTGIGERDDPDRFRRLVCQRRPLGRQSRRRICMAETEPGTATHDRLFDRRDADTATRAEGAGTRSSLGRAVVQRPSSNRVFPNGERHP